MHETLTASEIENFEYEKNNFLLLKLNECDINVACIYKYCASSVYNFVEKLEEKILKKNTIIVGDMNINLKNNDNETQNYKDMMNTNSYIFLNNLQENYHTPKRNHQPTYIDHVITDKIMKNYAISYIDTSISDHRAIMINIDFDNINTNKPKTHRYRIFDYEEFDKKKKLTQFVKPKISKQS